MKNKTTKLAFVLASLLLTMTVAACGNNTINHSSDEPKRVITAATTTTTETTTDAESTTTSAATTEDPHAPSTPLPPLYGVDMDGDGRYEYMVNYRGEENTNYHVFDDGVHHMGDLVIPTDEIEPFVYIDRLYFSAESITVNTAQLAPITKFADIIIEPANATYQDLVFSSNNEAVVRVDGQQFTFLSQGEAEITVTVPASGKSATLKVIFDTHAQQTVKPETTAPTTSVDTPATSDTPVTSVDTPVTTDTPVTSVDTPVTTTAPITSEAPVTTTPATSTTAPTTTTKAPTTTTAKPVTTTKAPTTTKTPVTTTAPHTHNYGPWNTTKAATCTADGTQTRTCACGKSETKTIAATGHSYGSAKVTKEATCSATGTKTATCKNCGDQKTETIAKTDHKYGTWTLCSDYINEEASCKTCGTKTTQTHYATEADERLVADRIIYYINKFRKEEGSTTLTKLPGYTRVAEYRSEQLVTNFAHDNADIKEADTQCEYGKKLENSTYDPVKDEAIYDGTYYYAAPGREAINQSLGYSYHTIDAVAKGAAESLHNSASHWAYVGSSEYSYIAVGVTYAEKAEYNGKSYSDCWFTCVRVCDTNQYE